MEDQTTASSAKPAIVKTSETCSPMSRHPNLLLVQWEIHFRNGHWLSACEIAEALVAALPGEPIGWVYRSFALHKLGRVHEARQHLLAAARRFPADWRIAYNLACYACQLGDIAGAWNWLDRAIQLGDADAVKSLALDEAAFHPLWQRTGQALSTGAESDEQMLSA